MESGEHIKRIKTLTNVLYAYIMETHPELSITLEDVETVTSASVLHDIGKIAIPDNILLKPGRLTAEEFDIMKTHSRLGKEILERFAGFSDVRFLDYAKDICLHHHEKIDGRGYPDGLKGNEIPVYVQVVSVADVYDALVSKRVYKDAYSHEQAMKMILNGECGAFNPLLMEVLVEIQDKIKEEIRYEA